MNKFWDVHYRFSFSDGTDVISVVKTNGSDCVDIEMNTNGHANGKITIRSKEMAEQLHFMLGQLLNESK